MRVGALACVDQRRRPEPQYAGMQGGADTVLVGAAHDLVSINIGAKDEQQAMQCAPALLLYATWWCVGPVSSS